MVKKNFLKSSLIVLAVAIAAVALIPTIRVNAASNDVPTLAYSAHVQGKGWMKGTSAGDTESKIDNSLAGTEGKSLRLEALKVTFTAPEGVTLKYDAHIQGIGWTGMTAITEANQLIGTEGASKRLEAIRFAVTGLEGYEIAYRAHVQGEGWQEWKIADETGSEMAGTTGLSRRIEALEVLVLKTSNAKVFNARQEAIAELNEYITSGDYTMNEKLLKEAVADGIKSLSDLSKVGSTSAVERTLKDAKKAVEAIMDDKEVNESLDNFNEAVDKIVTTYLDKTIADNEDLGKYADLDVVKEAVAAMKADAAKQEEYTKENTTYGTAANPQGLLKKEIVTLNKALANYGLELLEEVYNDQSSNDAGHKVMSTELYEYRKATLENKIKNENTDVAKMVGSINQIKPDKTLGELRTAAYKTMSDMVKDADNYHAVANKSSSGIDEKNSQALALREKEYVQILLSGTAYEDSTTFGSIEQVTDILREYQENLQECYNAPEINELKETTEVAIKDVARDYLKLIIDNYKTITINQPSPYYEKSAAKGLYFATKEDWRLNTASEAYTNFVMEINDEAKTLKDMKQLVLLAMLSNINGDGTMEGAPYVATDGNAKDKVVVRWVCAHCHNGLDAQGKCNTENCDLNAQD